MSVPQIKDRPASALRAMFAGISSLLSPKDKRKPKPAAEAPADAATTEQKPATQEVPAAETTTPDVVIVPPAAEPAAAEPQAEAATKAEPAAETAEPAAAAEPAETSAALPLANYDELTVASLRARLRNLTNDDLTLLLGYEREHQNRPEVVKMFQNRLVKMTTGLPKLQA